MISRCAVCEGAQIHAPAPASSMSRFVFTLNPRSKFPPPLFRLYHVPARMHDESLLLAGKRLVKGGTSFSLPFSIHPTPFLLLSVPDPFPSSICVSHPPTGVRPGDASPQAPPPQENWDDDFEVRLRRSVHATRSSGAAIGRTPRRDGGLEYQYCRLYFRICCLAACRRGTRDSRYDYDENNLSLTIR